MCIPECHKKASCTICFTDVDDDDDMEFSTVDGKEIDADDACCCSASDKMLCCAIGKLRIFTLTCKRGPKLLKCCTCCCSCKCFNMLLALMFVMIGILLLGVGGVLPFICIWQNVKLHLIPSVGIFTFLPEILVIGFGVFLLFIPINHFSYDPLNKIVNEKAKLKFAIAIVGMIVTILFSLSYTTTAYTVVYQKPQNPWDSFYRWVNRVRNPSGSSDVPDQDIMTPIGILFASGALAFGFLFIWSGRIIYAMQHKSPQVFELTSIEEL